MNENCEHIISLWKEKNVGNARGKYVDGFSNNAKVGCFFFKKKTKLVEMT